MNNLKKRFQLSELLRGLDILNPSFPDRSIYYIENDSRLVVPDSLFIAYSSYVNDSHVYIDSAYKNGCRNFIVEPGKGKPYSDKFPDALFIYHHDLRKALSHIALKYYDYPSKKLTVIGITGTNGKTTTATTIFKILRKLNQNAGMIGTIEYRINNEVIPATNTTPDILVLNQLLAKMVQNKVKYLVMEISSHSLELGRVIGLEPDITAFTNFTQDHLDFHQSMDQYFNAKLKIIDLLHSSSKTSKQFIVNQDMHKAEEAKLYAQKFSDIEVKTFSIMDKSADYYSDIDEMSPAHTLFEMNQHQYELGMIGKPNVYNFTLASAVLTQLGIQPSDFIPLMKDIRVSGRMENIPNEQGFHVLIDYAHTHDALENVLQTVRDVLHPDGSLITVFGAGGDRDRMKRPLMGKIAVKYSDMIIITSDNPRTENPGFIISEIKAGVDEVLSQKNQPKIEVIIEEDRRSAIITAVQKATTHDVIVIAGKGHEEYQVIGKQKHHFSDREEVLLAMNKIKL